MNARLTAASSSNNSGGSNGKRYSNAINRGTNLARVVKIDLTGREALLSAARFRQLRKYPSAYIKWKMTARGYINPAALLTRITKFPRNRNNPRRADMNFSPAIATR